MEHLQMDPDGQQSHETPRKRMDTRYPYCRNQRLLAPMTKSTPRRLSTLWTAQMIIVGHSYGGSVCRQACSDTLEMIKHFRWPSEHAKLKQVILICDNR